MPRGQRNKHNHNQRGRGRGRGGPPHLGGGGNPTTVPPATPPVGSRPRHPYPLPSAEIDVVIQQWAEPDRDVFVGGYGNGNGKRGHAGWRGGATLKSRSGAGTPSRRGDSTPGGSGSGSGSGSGRGWRGRGRGRGRGAGAGRGYNDNGGDAPLARRPHLGVGSAKASTGRLGNDATLSDLLYAERPLLRPIKFVRATLTPFLFQHSDEVLKPAGGTETSHVPTANRVAQLFHDTASNSDSDALEEIDFADLGQIRAEVDGLIAQGTATMVQDMHVARQHIETVDAANSSSAMDNVQQRESSSTIEQGMAMMDQDLYDAQQDIEEVDFADLAAIRAQVDSVASQAVSREDVFEEAFTGVYNHIKDTTQRSSTIVVQQEETSSTSPTPDDSLFKPSIEILNQSDHEFIPQTDAIVIEEQVADVPVEEETDLVPVLSNDLSPPPDNDYHPVFVTDATTITTEPVPILSNDLSPPPDDDLHPLFVIDTVPTLPFTNRSASELILVDRTGHGETLGDQEDEHIVYVAPHPRSGRASPIPVIPRVKLPRTPTSMSMLTGRSIRFTSPVREDDDGNRASTSTHIEVGEDDDLSLAALNLGPATSASYTQAGPKVCKKDAGLGRKRQRQNKRGRTGFGALGAMVSEARLREEDVRERQGPKWETRRRGDLDLDWGTDESEDEDEDGVNALSNGLEGMEIDPDLDLDVTAMQGFVQSMSVEGSRFVTMDDIEDEARMLREDEEGPEGSSDSNGEEDEVFNLEEGVIIAESDSEDALSEESDSDDGLSPRSSFQSRLRKARERSRLQYSKTVPEISEDEEEEEEIVPYSRGADDEDFIAHIYDILDENNDVLAGRDRKQKKAVFRDIQQDMWLDDPEFTTPVQKKKKQAKKNKGKQPTHELEAQWANDRAKKAVQKRERATARLLAALDPLSAPKNGKGASRKAKQAAMRLDLSKALTIAPNAITDAASLEAQIRRFVDEVRRGGRTQMAVAMVLPPMEKGMRKMVHEMAGAFGVKSVSRGDEGGRYTTLIGTGRTGVGVKEDKVRALVKRYRGGASKGKGKETGKGKGKEKEKGGRVVMPRQRDGDEVGKEAPKIGESNIGFKMLTSMGWSEGNRIGGTASVGIETPLTAIIKNSKLGLGATR